MHGSAVTIQAAQSDVILHVPDGVYGIILGNIHTDHWRFRHLVSEKDCIIGPICEYFFKGSEIPGEARFNMQVPHIVQDIHRIGKTIKVKCRHEGFFSHAEALSRRKNPNMPYFKFNNQHVEIYTPHFCQFFITAEGINCCSKRAAMLAFSKMELSESGPLAKTALYFGSANLMFKDYRQASIIRARTIELLKICILSASICSTFTLILTGPVTSHYDTDPRLWPTVNIFCKG